MTIVDVINQLSILKFGNNSWDPWLLINNARLDLGGLTGTFRYIGLSLIAVCFILEFFRQNKKALEDDNERPVKFKLVIFTILIGVTLFSPGVYQTFLSGIMSIGGAIQNKVSSTYVDLLTADVWSMGKTMAESSKNPFSWLAAMFEIVTPIGIISILANWIALGLLYLIPLIQATYFAIHFFLGFICLPFWLFEPFRGVAWFWLSQILAVSFFGVFASVGYAVISAGNLIQKIQESHSNHILSLFYSMVTIAVLVFSCVMSFSLFSTFKMSVMSGVRSTARLIRF